MRGLEQLLDRAFLIVRPRAPFARWALGEDTDPALQDLRKNPAVYAVEPLDADDPRIVLQIHWRTIFEAELAVWDKDKSKWPRSRTLTMFQRWFEVDVCPLVVDLVPRPSPSRKPIAWVTDLTHYLGDSRQPAPDGRPGFRRQRTSRRRGRSDGASGDAASAATTASSPAGAARPGTGAQTTTPLLPCGWAHDDADLLGP
jgi:hypothetical protein